MLDNKAIEQIKRTMKESINDNFIAGGNLLILKDGKEIFYHEDGFADIENSLVIKRDSIFRLYSMTKPITAVAVMMLVERGQIDLFDAVSNFLPNFKNQRVVEGDNFVPANREVNIKDLLSMTGGLVYPGLDAAGKETDELFKEINSKLFTDNAMKTVEVMNKLGDCALAFQPGTAWQYGTSADVLGAVVEVVSGKSFGQFLQDELFTPLGMKDTGFWVPDEKRNRLVNTYQQDGYGGLETYRGHNLGINNKMDRPPAFESGGAGLASTIDDYSKFANMLMNKGIHEGVQILRERTVKYLTTQALTEDQQKGIDTWTHLAGYSYSNLMRVLVDESKQGDFGSLGEYGWDGWLGPYLCNSPKDGLTILLMIQKTDAGTTSMTRKIRNIIFGALV